MTNITSIAKEYDERRTEIIETGAKLFSEHGYDQTSVSMIINDIGIAKGTFYHYFRSKDELLEEIVGAMVYRVANSVTEISQEEGLSALEKMTKTNRFFRTLAIGWEGITKFLHEDRNAHWHLKLENKLYPVIYDAYERMIEQGIKEGVFNVAYPRETAIAVISATNALTGRDHDHTGERNYDPEFIKAVMEINERLLGTEPGLLMREFMKEMEGKQ